MGLNCIGLCVSIRFVFVFVFLLLISPFSFSVLVSGGLAQFICIDQRYCFSTFPLPPPARKGCSYATRVTAAQQAFSICVESSLWCRAGFIFLKMKCKFGFLRFTENILVGFTFNGWWALFFFILLILMVGYLKYCLCPFVFCFFYLAVPFCPWIEFAHFSFKEFYLLIWHVVLMQNDKTGACGCVCYILQSVSDSVCACLCVNMQ